MDQVKLSVTIMAHPSRKRFVPSLLTELGDVPVTWDRQNSRWETGRRALLAHEAGATHHLVVQDDAILCDDFLEHVEAATEFAGNRPLGLYMGATSGGGPTAWRRGRAMEKAKRLGIPWIELEGPWWAVAIVLPTEQIPELIIWGDDNERSTRPIENFDRRISRWYELQGIFCWYTVPSLVNHRPVRQNPSLVPGRTANRQAAYYVQDPSGIDWSRPPIKVGSVQLTRRREVHVAKKQRIYVRDERGRAVLAEVRRRVIADRNIAVDGPHGVPVRIRAGKPVPAHLTTAYKQATAEDAAPELPATVATDPGDSPTPAVDDLGGKTVPQLRDLLRQSGLPTSGTKPELVARLEEARAA